MEEILKEVKEELSGLGGKIDGHFDSFNKSFLKHEEMELALINTTTKRMDKIDKMMDIIREDHHANYRKIIKKLRIFSYISIISLIISIIIAIIQWKN